MFIFERERERKSRGGAERERQRIQSRLCADRRELDAGLEFANREILSQSRTLNPLSHPGTLVSISDSPIFYHITKLFGE